MFDETKDQRPVNNGEAEGTGSEKVLRHEYVFELQEQQ